MVVVDVVVSDKSGKAAIGLKASDFQLTENGTSQTICVFEEHSVAPSLQRATPPPLPAGQYTNFPIDPPKNSVNILLFDLLNTRAEDQQWARLQMLKTLQKLPPGQQIALFTLGRSLQMVHGVSGDSSTLVAAANAILARPDSFTEGTRQHQNNVDRITMIPQASGMMNDPATPIGPFPGSMNVQSRLLLALDKAENATNDQRVRLTLQALEAIGRTVSAYPRHKSLIWITSGIPFQVLPNMRLDLGNRMYGASGTPGCGSRRLGPRRLTDRHLSSGCKRSAHRWAHCGGHRRWCGWRLYLRCSGCRKRAQSYQQLGFAEFHE